MEKAKAPRFEQNKLLVTPIYDYHEENTYT